MNNNESQHVSGGEFRVKNKLTVLPASGPEVKTSLNVFIPSAELDLDYSHCVVCVVCV